MAGIKGILINKLLPLQCTVDFCFSQVTASSKALKLFDDVLSLFITS